MRCLKNLANFLGSNCSKCILLFLLVLLQYYLVIGELGFLPFLLLPQKTERKWWPKIYGRAWSQGRSNSEGTWSSGLLLHELDEQKWSPLPSVNPAGSASDSPKQWITAGLEKHCGCSELFDHGQRQDGEPAASLVWARTAVLVFLGSVGVRHLQGARIPRRKVFNAGQEAQVQNVLEYAVMPLGF